MIVSARSATNRAQRGISLVEQIMVVAIVGTLLGTAVPSLLHVLGRNQVRVAQSDFMSALQHARSNAAINGKRTLFCPSLDGKHCSGQTQWEHGWLLGLDTDGDHQPDGGPSYTGAAYAGMRITSSEGRHDVRFQPDGSAGGSNLTLFFCDPRRDDQVLIVVVSNPGRIRGAPATAAQAANACRASDPTAAAGARY